MAAGKRESVMAVRIHSIVREAIDCKRFFRLSSGMLGRQHGMFGRL